MSLLQRGGESGLSDLRSRIFMTHKKKYIRPEIKDYIDMGLRVPDYVPLTPDEHEYLKTKHDRLKPDTL